MSESAITDLWPGARSPPRRPRRRRNTPACQGAAAAPIAEDSTAVEAYPPTATRRRWSGSLASAPPPNRATPASSSETPSISPSAEVGVPSTEVRNEGSSAMGISWPASDRKLAVPIPPTAQPNYRTPPSSSPAADWALRRTSQRRTTAPHRPWWVQVKGEQWGHFRVLQPLGSCGGTFTDVACRSKTSCSASGPVIRRCWLERGGLACIRKPG
jgi:hypothetical protein